LVAHRSEEKKALIDFPNELAPCPICGNEMLDIIKVYQGKPMILVHNVHCSMCGCTVPLMNWNTRAHPGFLIGA